MSNNKNIQYRFTSDGILLTDLLTNNYVKVNNDLFNEIKAEYMHRLDDKKYKNKKIELTATKPEDLPRLNQIMVRVVHDEMVPNMIHILNENMAKHNVPISVALMTAILGNLCVEMMANLLRTYPIPVQTTLSQLVSMDMIRYIMNMPDIIDKLNDKTMNKEQRMAYIDKQFSDDAKKAIEQSKKRHNNFMREINQLINDDVTYSNNNNYNSGTFKNGNDI